MLDAFIEQYATATITRAQTTYLDLAVATGRFRVHYRDKAEFLVRKGANGALALLKQNLADGSGLLLEGAPVVIAQAVSEVCQQHGAATYSLAPLGPAPAPVTEPFSLLFIGTCYVIARGFKVQEL